MATSRHTNRFGQASNVCVLLLALTALPSAAHALPTQDAPPEDAKADAAAMPGSAEDMAAFEEAIRLAQPGPEHEELGTLKGEWVAEVSVYAPGMPPDAPPMTQTTTTQVKTILGGRFLEITSAGDFMGMPYESQSYFGFDRRLGEYTYVGMDTLGTYWVSGAGQKDADGVIRMHGVDHDPMGKQVYTFEYELLGPDEFVHRVMFSEMGGQVFDEPFEMVSVRNTRKKPSARFEQERLAEPGVADASMVARGKEISAAIVETACGECQFDLPGESCDLAVRIGGVAWFVRGTSIDDHGDAHAADGFCNAVRKARVSGHVENDRFVVSEFVLVDDSEDEG
jgi:hypothetical protein